MKLKLKKKKPPTPFIPEDDEDEDSKPSTSSLPKGAEAGWMTSNRAEINAMNAAQKAQAQRKRRPELWFKAGDVKTVRFRHSDPKCFAEYSIKSGDRYDTYTKPAEGDRDLFAEVMGLQPRLRFLYEVIDITGYKDQKTGKQVKNVPRFFATNGKVYDVLQKYVQKCGPLTGYDIEITRNGQGTQTSYVLVPESPTPMTQEMKKAENLLAKIAEYYAPPTEQEQVAIARAKGFNV